MKFHQLPVGSRFRYQGETLIKTSPLVACLADSGQQKFMPRSAQVTPLANTPEAEQETSPTLRLDAERVRSAFEDFYARCQQNLDSLASDPDSARVEDIRQDLAKARERFLHRLSR